MRMRDNYHGRVERYHRNLLEVWYNLDSFISDQIMREELQVVILVDETCRIDLFFRAEEVG